jgi:hypothetical protein
MTTQFPLPTTILVQCPVCRKRDMAGLAHMSAQVSRGVLIQPQDRLHNHTSLDCYLVTVVVRLRRSPRGPQLRRPQRRWPPQGMCSTVKPYQNLN